MSGHIVRTLFGGQKYEYTRLGDSVQNVKKSKVYVFGDDDVAEVEEDVIEFEMDKVRPRKGKNSIVANEETPSFVERRVTEDDTLQSLSLQYGCPIAELKRVNNLIKDQDFYALTSVKIPVKQHSFLIDQIQADDESARSVILLKTHKQTSLSNGAAFMDSGDDQSLTYDSGTDQTTADLSDPETQRHIIHKINRNKTTRSQSKEAVKFLKDMDKDLSHILKSTRTDRNSLDEVISVLTHKSVNPLVMPQRKKSTYTDCVIEWRTALIILIIVAVVVPIIFVIHSKQ